MTLPRARSACARGFSILLLLNETVIIKGSVFMKQLLLAFLAFIALLFLHRFVS